MVWEIKEIQKLYDAIDEIKVIAKAIDTDEEFIDSDYIKLELKKIIKICSKTK